ncbi:MAG: LexA family protein [Allosphingosinicella sp.]
MVSRKLQAFDFILRYFAAWGHSPSLDEIAAELGVSKQRADELVHALARDQMIRRIAGKRRGIRLIDRADELSEAEVLVRLRSLGWQIGHDNSLTKIGLPDLPFLDHDDPADCSGAGIDGGIDS